MSDNYFRVGRGPNQFFDSKDEMSARRAWERAKAHEMKDGPRVCVFKTFALHGPWYGCDVIAEERVGRCPPEAAPEMAKAWQERRDHVFGLWEAAR